MADKTKRELLCEIDSLKEQIDKRSKEEANDRTAQEIRSIYDSMVKVGFTEEQAWEFLMLSIKNNK